MGATPELINLAMKKKSPKQALENSVTKTQENKSLTVDVAERHQ